MDGHHHSRQHRVGDGLAGACWLHDHSCSCRWRGSRSERRFRRFAGQGPRHLWPSATNGDLRVDRRCPRRDGQYYGQPPSWLRRPTSVLRARLGRLHHPHGVQEALEPKRRPRSEPRGARRRVLEAVTNPAAAVALTKETLEPNRRSRSAPRRGSEVPIRDCMTVTRSADGEKGRGSVCR